MFIFADVALSENAAVVTLPHAVILVPQNHLEIKGTFAS